MAVNTGARPMLIERFWIQMGDSPDWTEAVLYSESGQTDFFAQSEVLGPSQVGHYAAKVPGSTIPDRFRLKADVVTFRGRRQTVEVIIPKE